MHRYSWVWLSLILTMGLGSGYGQAAELADTVSAVKPSIVGIGTYSPGRRPPSRLLGTGFVVGDGRHIATNAHVVNMQLDDLKKEQLVVFVGTGNNPRVMPAKVVASEPHHDLALLNISDRLPVMKLSNRTTVREGENYAFTGFPLGAILGLYPVTHRGMISSITPMGIPAQSSGQLSAHKIRQLRQPLMVYQLDATAYPGNSGSPLYDPDDGAVVGIINGVYVKSTKEDVLSDPSGISYAIPVRYLRELLSSQTDN
ncbi:S1 family peptidase [Marinobacterium sedimentorum]|uniref:S1 family peptidase n=1 Tax=Marinobacterium sedimentorum TaxID=2927804 RepID=UPI0020C68422|nr:serine protease [Marinobacterium sedimentorum]MCP8686807.1 serine protease [Marinobacterium sedimentorum]